MHHHGNIRETRLTERIVAAVVKDYAERAGFKPDEFGGHSLRSGFATSAARGGASEAALMRQTRHKSVTVLVAIFAKAPCGAIKRKRRSGSSRD